VYGLIAVNARQSFVNRVNHEIHRLKGQRPQEDILRVRYDQGLPSGTAVLPLYLHRLRLPVPGGGAVREG
jgi:hypothetical protein